MSENLFAIAEVMPGQLNAMVKNIMAQMAIDDPNEAVRRVNSGEWKVRLADLLRRVATVPVTGAKKFVAKDYLQSANVGYTGGNFDKFFLNKIEENVGDATIAIHNLERDSLDAPIMAELGNRAQIKLAHFFTLLEKQSKGEDGPLLTNGRANVAYIIGNDGNVWAVGAYWHSGCRDWDLSAYSVENPHRWLAGRQILSCDFL